MSISPGADDPAVGPARLLGPGREGGAPPVDGSGIGPAVFLQHCGGHPGVNPPTGWKSPEAMLSANSRA
jgi:hypothetical protein